jgi:hypothetical protein
LKRWKIRTVPIILQWKKRAKRERESGRAGERESGRAGERESGRAGERESGRNFHFPSEIYHLSLKKAYLLNDK